MSSAAITSCGVVNDEVNSFKLESVKCIEGNIKEMNEC